jgi:putative transposase
MDGRGRYLDNIFIERLWWSLKYECVYLNEFADGRELGRAIKGWIHFYNTERLHSALAYRTPDEAYSTGLPKAA